tara:strand:- start:24184 stop:25491 length:1308 start_codon:yes stop_codon:yes gene_type:complete
MNKIRIINWKSLTSFFILINICLGLIFARSYTGIIIFGFRLGEFLVLIGLASVIYSFLTLSKNNKPKTIEILLFLSVLGFIISVLIDQASFVNSYIYKSSSYIWMIGFYFIGKNLTLLIDKNKKYRILLLIPLINYLFFTIYYPNSFISFFKNYADKFQFLKGSNAFLAYVVGVFIAKLIFKNKYNYLNYLVLTTALTIPQFLYLSRGAFLPAIIFVLTELFLLSSIIKKNLFRSIVLFVVAMIIFIISSFLVYGNLNFDKTDLDKITKPEEISSTVTGILKVKKTDELFLSFFIRDNRLYSEDSTTNWRLQIWQDVIFDLNEKNKLFIGYGYTDIIPAMDDPERKGNDGTNENVHNFIINILARGGILGLIFYLFILNRVYIESKSIKKINVYNFMLPLLIASLFDSSMESVAFPAILYLFLGIFNNYLNKDLT